jgi:hypothetical protein
MLMGHDPDVHHLLGDGPELVELAEEQGFYAVDFGSANVGLYLVGVESSVQVTYAAEFIKGVLDLVDDDEDGEMHFFSVIGRDNLEHLRLRSQLEDTLKPYKLMPERTTLAELTDDVSEGNLIGVCFMPLDLMVDAYKNHPSFTNGLPYLLLVQYSQDDFFTRFLNE